MDNRLQIIQSLLPDIERFCEENPQATATDFIDYLRGELQSKENNKSSEAINHMQGYGQVKTMISFHLGRLGKYAKYYMKEVLKDTPLVGSDDFAFLATLAQVGDMSKSELIAYNVAEVSSGMEIARRLVKNGLAKEVINRDDRRVRLLSITPEGRNMMFAIISKLGSVSSIVAGNLTPVEQQQLVELLGKLDHFHQNIYDNEDEYDLDLISEKYLE